jgi:hypothetical protein
MSLSGRCHICGEFSELTEEHVPPQKAYNDMAGLVMDLHQWDQFQNTGKRHGRHHQGGFGVYTLCGKCNPNTGSWYGGEYVKWAREGLIFLQKMPTENTLGVFSIKNCYPLRFLKQVVTMFFSVNDPNIFRHQYPDLVDFVLNKESTGLDAKYDFYCSLYRGPVSRYAGVSAIFRVGHGVQVLSEIAHVPFAFALVLNQNPDATLSRISHFANYTYCERTDVSLSMFLGDGYTPFPLDYRSKEQVEIEAGQQLCSA